MNATTKAVIDKMFKSECLNKGYCNFPLRQLTMFPDQFCKTGYNYTQMLYFMQVKCQKDEIKVFDTLALQLDKNILGYIVVGCDILIVLVFYLMIAFLGSNIDIVKGDVDQANITASDFTAEIRGMLPCSEKYPSGPLGLDLFKAELWQWIEDLCKKNAGEPL